jgi:hypothetical protein
MATFDLNIELAQRGVRDAAALREAVQVRLAERPKRETRRDMGAAVSGHKFKIGQLVNYLSREAASVNAPEARMKPARSGEKVANDLANEAEFSLRALNSWPLILGDGDLGSGCN